MIFLRSFLLALGLLVPAQAAEKPGDRVAAFLDSIVLPLVRFDDDTLEEAVDYARIRCLELDTNRDVNFRGISIIIKYPEGKPKPRPRITLKADDVRLSDLLIEIADQAGMDVHITTLGVVMCFSGDAPFPVLGRNQGEVLRTIHRTEAPSDEQDKSEQTGARQPAAPSESDSEGGDKPQPESEARSR